MGLFENRYSGGLFGEIPLNQLDMDERYKILEIANKNSLPNKASALLSKYLNHSPGYNKYGNNLKVGDAINTLMDFSPVGDVKAVDESITHFKNNETGQGLLSGLSAIPILGIAASAARPIMKNAKEIGLPQKAIDQGYQRGFWRGGAPPDKNGEMGGQQFYSRDKEYAVGFQKNGGDFREWALNNQKPLKMNGTHTYKDLKELDEYLKSIGDKQLQPYLKEIVEDDYAGAMPGAAIYQLLDNVGIESAEGILRNSGFDAIDTGRDIRRIVKHGVRKLDAEFNPLKKLSPNVGATLAAGAIGLSQLRPIEERD